MFEGEWFSDCAIMYSILETVPVISGSDRKRMQYVPDSVGGSCLYGTTWKSYISKTKNREPEPETNLYKTKLYSERPELKAIFKEFADLYFPDHKYNNIQVNKNFPCVPHFDSLNQGVSCLVSFGDYLGGESCLYNEENRKIEEYDARVEPLIFDGSKILHWVNPIRATGTRYSLVFFLKKN